MHTSTQGGGAPPRPGGETFVCLRDVALSHVSLFSRDVTVTSGGAPRTAARGGAGARKLFFLARRGRRRERGGAPGGLGRRRRRGRAPARAAREKSPRPLPPFLGPQQTRVSRRASLVFQDARFSRARRRAPLKYTLMLKKSPGRGHLASASPTRGYHLVS